MRPILVNIPAKLLFFAALVLAIAAFARDLIRRRRDRTASWTSTPLYLLVGASVVLYLKADTLWPGAAAFSHPWTPVPIYAYGVMLGTSLVVGWFIAMNLAGKDGIDQQEAGTIYMWTAVWSIVGSRLLWYFTTPEARVIDIPMVNQGGLVAYGGMIGGFLSSVYCCRRRGIPLLQWADVAAPSVVLGTAITRIGCFLFGCDYGARTSLPWAVHFPGPNPLAPHGSPAWQHHVANYGLASTATQSFGVHPTQLYESLVGLSLFALLMLIRKYRTFSGQVFLGWVIGYGILRPLIEQVRDDDDRGVQKLSGFQLSTSTVIGFTSVVLGVALLVALVRKYRRDPDGSKLWLHPVAAGPAVEQAPAKGGQGGGSKRRKRR
jgi:prolipoprotein diacylglyceryl transferase